MSGITNLALILRARRWMSRTCRKKGMAPAVTHGDRFMYHSFPRSKDQDGFETLRAILRSGVLLVPEIVSWPAEFMADGSRGPDIAAGQKRVCFTELSPSELPAHAQTFGEFAIEIETHDLRRLGALPVMYVPVAADDDGLSGLGQALVARAHDTQQLLERLKELLDFALVAEAADPGAQIGVRTDSGTGDLMLATSATTHALRFPKSLLDQTFRQNPEDRPVVPVGGALLGITAGGLASILRMITWNLQSTELQRNSLRGLAGLLYPTERIGRSEPLAYYRQREWRILGNVAKKGQKALDKPTSLEIEALLALNARFFGKTLPFRSGPKRVADECEYLRDLDGRPFRSFIRRIVCPRADRDRVCALVGDHHMPIEVVAPESA